MATRRPAGSWLALPDSTDRLVLLTVAAGVLSAVLLVLFWSTNLVFGLVIDAALVVIAVPRPDWADRIVG